MDLPIKYRPTTLEKVVGQDEVVRSLSRLITAGRIPHALLLSGPSGVGKTTLARIFAQEVKAAVVEVDGATYTGIDAMRTITESLQYRPLHELNRRCIIIDECHALSKQSWQSLLKAVEEPPSHSYFCFCTTEVDKVPKTIVTRCQHYVLKLVPVRSIEAVLFRISKMEKLRVDEDAVNYIARHSMGSVRQAISYLATCAGAKDLDEVKALVASGAESRQAIDLFRLITSGRATWSECLKILTVMEKSGSVSYESVRIGLMNYTGAVLMKAKSAEQASQHLAVVEAFGRPLNRSTERADFLLALGTLVI